MQSKLLLFLCVAQLGKLVENLCLEAVGLMGLCRFWEETLTVKYLAVFFNDSWVCNPQKIDAKLQPGQQAKDHSQRILLLV